MISSSEFCQNHPRVLCLSATMTEISEQSTMRHLGLDPAATLKLTRNPVNNRISLINIAGRFQIGPVAQYLREGNCPRIIIFENSLVDCGKRYLEFRQVYF